MDLRQLRYFVQIVESGSFAKASRQLYIAQPALSQHIAKLESEVGKPLLIRTAKGVTPTENGTALLHQARFILRQLEQALSIARQEPGTVHGMVSVGLAATTVCAVGAPFMRRIREKYPGIVLNIVEGMSGHLAQMMRLGQLDLAILFSRDAVSDLPCEPLVEEELFILLPEDSNLVPPRRIKLSCEETAHLPLILPTGIHGLRRRITAEFERRNLVLNVVAEVDSTPSKTANVTFLPNDKLGVGWDALLSSTYTFFPTHPTANVNSKMKDVLDFTTFTTYPDFNWLSCSF